MERCLFQYNYVSLMNETRVKSYHLLVRINRFLFDDTLDFSLVLLQQPVQLIACDFSNTKIL